jgi:hypothetical protein
MVRCQRRRGGATTISNADRRRRHGAAFVTANWDGLEILSESSTTREGRYLMRGRRARERRTNLPSVQKGRRVGETQDLTRHLNAAVVC